MAWTWLKGLFRSRRKSVVRPSARSVSRTRSGFRPELQALEDRLVPAVSLTKAFQGQTFQNTFDTTLGTEPNFEIPADPSIAVGPTRIMQIVNSSIVLMDKKGAVMQQSNLYDFFFPALPVSAANADPTVVYDDIAQRFYVFLLTSTPSTNTIYFAAFRTSTPNYLVTTTTPNGTFGSDVVESGTITLTFTSATNGALSPQNLKIGYNREAVVAAVNMVNAAGVYDSTQILTIEKFTMFDFRPGTLFIPATGTGFNATFTQVNDLNYGMVPARMHNAPANSPMFFISTQGIGGNGTQFSSRTLRMTRMTNVLSANPTLEFFTYGVPDFRNGALPLAGQPDEVLNVGDTRMTSFVWRNNRLAAAQTVRIGNEATVRWYEWDATSRKPSLVQNGTVDPGPGVMTYFPAIEISANNDLGLVFNQSGPREFMSVYITGRTTSDPRGFMQTPQLLFAGTATYRDESGQPFTPGRYASIAVDPASPNSFWATGVYANGERLVNNWSTYIGNFTMSRLMASPLKLLGPTRWVYDRTTDSLAGTVTFVNAGPSVLGTFVFQVTIDPAVTIFAPAGYRLNNNYFIPVTGRFETNQPLRFTLQVRNPNRVSMGTFFLSWFTDII